MRKPILGNAVLLVITISLVGITVSSNNFARAESKRISDLETLQREVVGRPLENQNRSVRVTIEPNGKLSGFRNNEKIGGKWEFRDGYFCRSFIVGSNIGQENCQVISYDENGITIIRSKGRGDRIKYRFSK